MALVNLKAIEAVEHSITHPWWTKRWIA